MEFPTESECLRIASAVRKELEQAMATHHRLNRIGLKVEDVIGVFLLNMNTLKIDSSRMGNLDDLYQKMIRSMRKELITLPETYPIPQAHTKVCTQQLMSVDLWSGWDKVLTFYNYFLELLVDKEQKRKDSVDKKTAVSDKEAKMSPGFKMVIWCGAILCSSNHVLCIEDVENYTGWVLKDFLKVLEQTMANSEAPFRPIPITRQPRVASLPGVRSSLDFQIIETVETFFRLNPKYELKAKEEVVEAICKRYPVGEESETLIREYIKGRQ